MRERIIGARAGLGVGGSFMMRKFNRAGLRVPVRIDRNLRTFQRVWEHQQENLITDAGMNHIGTSAQFASLLNYVAVGTGSGAPDVTDTALGAEIARTNANLSLTGDSYQHPSTGVQRFTRGVAFNFGEANGNLTEIGGFAGGSGGSALTRALLVDGSGNPVTVTKTSDEQLAVDYSIELSYGPTSLTPVPDINIAGYGSFQLEHMFYRAYAADVSNALVNSFNNLAVTLPPSVGATYDHNLGGASTSGWTSDVRGRPDWRSNRLPSQTQESYVGDSHKLVYAIQLTAGTVDVEYNGFILYNQTNSTSSRYAVCGWRFTNPTTLLNHKDYRLKLMAELHWSRA